jgi:hypothetical protein
VKHKNKRLARILELGENGLIHALRNPRGKLHEFERENTEPWQDRWERMFNVKPSMVEQKRTTNADNSDSLSATVKMQQRRRRKRLKKRV